MINKVKKMNKKYIVLFLFFILLLITPFTYSRYTSKYTKHIFISATNIGYKVEFNPNGGNGTMETQAFVFGVAQKLKENDFTKPGYVFLNWNTKADGTGTSYEDQQEVRNLTDQDGETITLYAIYVREKFVQNGDITFGGENSTNSYIDTKICLFSEENINRDFEVSFEVKERGENDGYLNGEYPTIMSAMDESGAPWPGMVFRIFNQWDDQLVINAAQNNGINRSYHLTGNQKVTLKRINGAIYLSLNDENDVELINLSSMDTTFNVPVVFGASLDGSLNPQRWFKGTLSNLKVIVKDPNTEIGTINFYPNYEDRQGFAQHVLANAPYNLIENTYTREGYIFTGWNTMPDGSGDSYQDGQEITTNLVDCGGRVNLYAQWETYKYTIVFDANNGTGDTVQQEFESAQETTLRLNSFTTSGLDFAFWTTGQNGSGDVYHDGETIENLGTPGNQVITLYANYEQFSYQNSELTFDGTNYINTHIYLFSRENVNKDFEISFEIKDYINTRNYNTIVSSLDESGAPYPGFVFRINDSTEIGNSTQEYNFEANASEPRQANKFYTLETKKVVIKRVNHILYLKLDDNPEAQIIDYSTLSRSFYYPLTVGASLNSNFDSWRNFHGTISNLSITLDNSGSSETTEVQ